MIEGHGDDLFRYRDRIKINFSTNIPQTVNHDGLLSHLSACGAVFSNYPEPEAGSVVRKLAELHDSEKGNIIVTNGATEAIYLIAQSFFGKKSAIVVPTFREYQDACSAFRHDIKFIKSLTDIMDVHPDLVWLCNPNNPTGMVYDHNELLEMIDRFSEILFVVDQAYAPYSVKPVLADSDIHERKNVILLYSLTKQFMIPGLRIGYAIGNCEVIENLKTVRMPWSVNSIAIEASHYLLSHTEDYAIDFSAIHNEALRISDALKEFGIAVLPTDCNFLLASLPNRRASELKEWLIKKHGILIRDASNFESLSFRHFRVAVQTPEENDQLIEALKEWRSL